MSRYAYDTAFAMDGIGTKPIIIAPAINHGERFYNAAGLHIVRPAGMSPDKIFDHYLLNTANFFLYGLRYCLRGDIGIILANSWTMSGLAAFLLGKLFRIPYAIFAHGLDIGNPEKSKKVDALMRMVLSGASTVLANSNYTKGLVEKTVPGTNVAVLHPPLGPVVCYKRYSMPDKKERREKALLTVARLVEHKGQDTVLRSLPLIIKRFPGIIYRIVGEGPYEARLREIARELGLDGHVKFEGKVSDEELASIYEESDIFVMVSRSIPERGEVEGFGIVYLEAGSFGKPVIGARSGGIPDAVLNGVTGVLVNPLDEKELADAVMRVLSDDVLAKRMGDEGKRRAAEDLSIEIFGAQLRKLIGWS